MRGTELLSSLFRNPLVFHGGVDIVKVGPTGGDGISQCCAHDVIGMITGHFKPFDVGCIVFGVAADDPGGLANTFG